VLLNWDSNNSDCDTAVPCVPRLARTLADGSIVENFAIPAGKALIVTDVDWFKSGGTVDTNVLTVLILRYGGVTALWSNVISDSDLAFPTAGKNEHLVSGLVLTDMSKFTVATTSPFTRTILTMRGYLVSR
jgi:hypothetical protein